MGVVFNGQPLDTDELSLSLYVSVDSAEHRITTKRAVRECVRESLTILLQITDRQVDSSASSLLVKHTDGRLFGLAARRDIVAILRTG